MNLSVGKLIELDPFHYDRKVREELFHSALREVAIFHYENCTKYRRFCQNYNFDPKAENTLLGDYPYIPVNIFKSVDLISVNKDKLVKKIQSSATTSGIPSKVHIDMETSKKQTRVSSAVMKDFLFDKRHMFFLLDADPSKGFHVDMTARIAATRGFLILARKHKYFMESDANGKLSLCFNAFVDECKNYESNSEDMLTIFGFTFIVYEHVIKPLLEKGISLNLKDAKLAHIGGWKKLKEKRVSSEKFKQDVQKTLGILPKNIVDFYGFTEQMGIIYGENEYGYKITPAYAEVIIRDRNSLEPVANGQEGFIQTISPIFSSFPGISVITEDIGRIIGKDQSKCGRLGTCFEILGRAEKAEVRGCGDLMEEKMVL